MSAALATSQGNTATLPLALVATAAFASSSTSGRRASSATSAPLAAKRVAIARPSPLLAPVIMAVRPRRLISIWMLSYPVMEPERVAASDDGGQTTEVGRQRTDDGRRMKKDGKGQAPRRVVAIRPLSSVLCRPSSVVRPLSSAVRTGLDQSAAPLHKSPPDGRLGRFHRGAGGQTHGGRCTTKSSSSISAPR